MLNAPIEGIPKIIEYFEVDNQLIVIEEYISGNPLNKLIDNHSLKEIDAVSYLNDLCGVLDSLHNMNPPIIHRDIKPSNIIISSNNKPILLDFNAAKHYSNSSSEDTTLIGTQGYAAPEQYGFGASSPQTDIYALGIVFEEMLDSCDARSAKYNQIIEKCTRLEPGERYPSARSLAEAINSTSSTKEKLQSTNSKRLYLKFLPPGFRTLNPLKMIFSTTVYALLFWLCLSLEVADTYGFALWFERIMLLIMFISIVFATFNYLDMQRLMPLCKSKNRIVHYIGVAIFDVVLFFSLLLLLVIIELCFLS